MLDFQKGVAVLYGLLVASFDKRVDGFGTEAECAEFGSVGLNKNIAKLSVVLPFDMDGEVVHVVEQL